MGSEEGRMGVRPVLVLDPVSLRIFPAGVMYSTAQTMAVERTSAGDGPTPLGRPLVVGERASLRSRDYPQLGRPGRGQEKVRVRIGNRRIQDRRGLDLFRSQLQSETPEKSSYLRLLKRLKNINSRKFLFNKTAANNIPRFLSVMFLCILNYNFKFLPLVA